MTGSEQLLWKELRKLGLNFHRASLVIEVDGGVHERLDEVALRDGERQLWLESQGYTVMRFTNGQVEGDLESCVEQVRVFLRAMGTLREEDAELKAWREWTPAPTGARDVEAVHTPPSPALPPSRRKGE